MASARKVKPIPNVARTLPKALPNATTLTHALGTTTKTFAGGDYHTSLARSLTMSIATRRIIVYGTTERAAKPLWILLVAAASQI